MRVLIVDDSRAMQSIIKRSIQKAAFDGMEIKTASTGAEALDIIRIWHPDLVLTDWHMPEMDGLELMQRIEREMLDIKVGFITTENSPARIAEAQEAGAVFVVTKPFQDEELLALVRPVLENATPRPSASEPAPEPIKTFRMPTALSFAEIINDFSRQEVLVEETSPIAVTSKQLPCLVGLLDDGITDVVRAVCVLELSTACILGAAMKNIPAEEVRAAIAKKTIPSVILEGCESLLQAVSTTIHDTQDEHDLRLSSINVVPKIFPKLETIYAESRGGRADFEIGMVGYGEGLMTIITA